MKARNVVISAPGKVILHGEHAVVYGKPAVAASIGLRTTVSITSSQGNHISLELQKLNRNFKWTTDELEKLFPELNGVDDRHPQIPTPVSAECFKAIDNLLLNEDDSRVIDAVKVFLFFVVNVLHENKRLCPVNVLVSSNLPIGAGLGSSASYSISLITAMLAAQGFITPETSVATASSGNAKRTRCNDPDNKELLEMSFSPENLSLICGWAFEAEKLIHGKPSGIDNSIGTFGGAIQFFKGEITHLENFPNLKILLIDTKIPRSTRTMVSGVRDRYQEYPTIYGPLFDAMSGITHEALKVLQTLHQLQNLSAKESSVKKSSFSKLEGLIDMNQQLLSIIGVSHPVLDQLCQITANYGLHSKLTGAGGGGCAFTLLTEGTTDEDISKLCEDLTKMGHLVSRTSLGGAGVVLHKLDQM